MPIIPQGVQRLLIKIPGGLEPTKVLSAAAAAARPFVAAAVAPLGRIGSAPAWHVVTPAAGAVQQHPWDAAHALSAASATADLPAPYVEPDLLQDPLINPAAGATAASLANLAAAINAPAAAGAGDLDSHWPPAPAANAPLAWHLDPTYSQLKDARDTVGDRPATAGVRRVIISHLDTGYSETHETAPLHLRRDAAWNFVENIQSAVDPADYHGLMLNPGHGTATIGILAGNRCSLTGDFLGGAPYADVIPVRVADSVVHFMTSAMANGIHHALGWSSDVISLSMGGLPAQSWADAVNTAYESGCIIFAASGDSIGGFPTRFTVYPGRFARVVSVCGGTYSLAPYFDSKYDLQNILEGNFGPDSAMQTALTAYTPNIMWAKVGTVNGYSRSGSGTSASTPQCAAAAALFIQQRMNDLASLAGWQKVEAVRNALFDSAGPGDPSTFGKGFLRANDALSRPLRVPADPTPPDTIDFALLKELFGFGQLSPARQSMLMVEAAQLSAASGPLQEVVSGTDADTRGLSAGQKKDIVSALASAPNISRTLQTFLKTALDKM